ncbi:MAG: NAD(P)-binding protein [Deltaproteobacteria bacterium]|nr:NAD(P)-binding protein [Deltaproteobacteria bacterium]
MSSETVSADYAVVGAGAMGMAFVDTLLTETGATVVMIDKHHRPGGHWNDAYPYVRLHQPSAFYGVNSKALGGDVKDRVGWNAGLYELASGAEVLAYFDHVMQRQFLPSGRVQYFPRCEWLGDGRFRSIPSGRTHRVRAKNVVDATYMRVKVPSVRAPEYAVAAGVRRVPLNELPRCERPAGGYVVVGAGKTGMDACLWLLANGVDADEIAWIVPRDSWILDRASIQPAEFFGRSMQFGAKQMEAIAGAASIDDVFARSNATGVLLRLDERVKPTMYRCATVTAAEAEQLRRIRRVIRLGRVKRIDANEIVLANGTAPARPDALYVDCSADALEKRPVAPVFAGDRITLQTVRACQQVFSAAFIAHVEAAYSDEALKNELCTVVPHPNTDMDYLRVTLANALNDSRWSQDAGLSAWLLRSRLNLFGLPPAAPDAAMLDAAQRIAASAPAAIATLQRLVAEAEAR